MKFFQGKIDRERRGSLARLCKELEDRAYAKEATESDRQNLRNVEAYFMEHFNCLWAACLEKEGCVK